MSDPWYELVLRLFDAFESATASFWQSREVRRALLPITTGSISSPMGLGSDSTPVKVNIAGVDTYLADSQQFSLEFACRIWPQGCYYVMPSFRGEPNDERHLGQFFHSEAELPGTLDDVMRVVEEYVRHLGQFFLEHFEAEILANAGSCDHVRRLVYRSVPFARITFADAVHLLRDVPGAVVEAEDKSWRTLSREGEQALIERKGDFTWVTHFDELAVPFYQATEIDSWGTRVARNGDLLFGIGETVGAGERHVTVDDVIAALVRHGVDAEEYNWYLQMRQVSPLRTSGFGMGVERFLLWLLQHDDIRDLQLLARANGRNIVP